MAYGKYKEATIYGQKGTAWRVEIWKNNYTGDLTEFNMQGEGFEITWNGAGGTRDRTFLASECRLNYLVETQADEDWLYGTFVAGYEDCFIRIYKSSETLGTLTNNSDVAVDSTPIIHQTYTKAAELTLDGVNDYISFSSAIISSSTVWTLAITLKDFNSGSSTNNNWLFGGDFPQRNIGLRATNLNDKVFFRAQSSTYYEFDYEMTSATTRLVFVSNGTTISLYVNGAFNSSITPTTTSVLLKYIGAGYWVSGSPFYLVKATLSNFQAWSRAWSEAEVQHDFTQPDGLQSNTASLLVNLKINESQGTSLYNSAGNDGTIYGDAHWEPITNPLGLHALKFDGLNDYLSWASPIVNNLTVWSVAITIKDYAQQDPSWLFAGASGYRKSIGLGRPSNAKKPFYRANDDTYHLFDYTIPDTDSHRLVFTSNGTSIHLYVDGQLADSITPASTELYINLIGGPQAGAVFMLNATLSNFHAWSSTWSAADVLYDYNHPGHLITANTSSAINANTLIARLLLNEGTGTAVYDSSQNTNNATLYGPTWDISDKTAVFGFANRNIVSTNGNGQLEIKAVADGLPSISSGSFWGTGAYLFLASDAGLLGSSFKIFDLNTASKYKVTFTITLTGSSAYVLLYNTVAGTLTYTSSGTYTAILSNTDTLRFSHIQSATTNEIWYIDDVKIEKITGLNSLWWFGWMQPSFDRIENDYFPYQFQLTFTDSYGFFGKQKPSYFANETAKRQAVRIKDVLLTDFGDAMKIFESSSSETNHTAPVPPGQNWLRTSIDWWRPEDTYRTNDPFHLYYVTRGAVAKKSTFKDNGKLDQGNNPLEYKKNKVLDGVLKTFNSVGFLAEGHYNFIQPNNYADNTTGQIYTYDYERSETASGANINTLLTIDQENHAILTGSTLVYEPSLESVRAKFNFGTSFFNISPGQDLTSSFIAGSTSSNSGTLKLIFKAIHSETILPSSFSFAANGFTDNYTFQTTATLTFSITNGTSTIYLTQTTDLYLLSWTTTPSSITIHRGFRYGWESDPVNRLGLMAVGPTQNQTTTRSEPCKKSTFGTNFVFTTDLFFSGDVEEPSISGETHIQLTASNNYYQAQIINDDSYFYPYHKIIPLNNPTPISSSTTSKDIRFTPKEENDSTSNTGGLTYFSEQTHTKAWENHDLGQLDYGQASTDKLFCVQYYNSSTSQMDAIDTGFQRGNPSPDAPRDIIQLLTYEFLQLQIEPLEILQASIQSNDISPLKLIKYSINNNSSFKYYLFLGGTFKAQSEIMSGEWYRVNSHDSGIIEPTPVNDVFDDLGTAAGNTALEDVLKDTIATTTTLAATDALGSTTTAISADTSHTAIAIPGGTTGTIYENQKVELLLSDGSKPLTVTASATTAANATSLPVNSFTSDVEYPAGSLVRMPTTDLSNVYQRKSENIGQIYDNAIYLTPNSFIQSGSNYVAEIIIPANHKVTKVDLKGSSSYTFNVLYGSYGSNAYNAWGNGTVGTELTLSGAIYASPGRFLVLIVTGTVISGKVTLVPV